MESNKKAAKRGRNYAKLIEALQHEHVGMCHSTACDINAAYDHGSFLYAAHALINATEGCIEVEKEFSKFNASSAEIEQERKTFVAETPQLICKACNSVNWNVDGGDSCGACTAELPRYIEEVPDWSNVAGKRHPDVNIEGSKSLRDMANTARTVLNRYGQSAGLDPEGDGYETIMGDLLSDFMHFCDMKGIDFESSLDSARRHYGAEIDEED